MLRATCLACVLVHAATAHAEPPQQPAGIAVGAEVGEPASATIGWFSGKLAVLGAVGTGTREGIGIEAHADAQVAVAQLRPDTPLRVGLGVRYYHHGYQYASPDELPDTHLGVRVPVTLAMERGALELYAEASPGVDLMRTRSCSLMDGPFSVCPHAQESPLFLQLVVGARWFFSH
jgi:hypothetical protein